jgi:hypothetical protein
MRRSPKGVDGTCVDFFFSVIAFFRFWFYTLALLEGNSKNPVFEGKDFRDALQPVGRRKPFWMPAFASMTKREEFPPSPIP